MNTFWMIFDTVTNQKQINQWTSNDIKRKDLRGKWQRWISSQAELTGKV